MPRTDPNRYVSLSAKNRKHWTKRGAGWKNCAPVFNRPVCRDHREHAANWHVSSFVQRTTKLPALPQQTALYFATTLHYFVKASGAHVRENRGRGICRGSCRRFSSARRESLSHHRVVQGRERCTRHSR